ncbi:hypothetical protein [Kribbella sp. NPDC006257]|uniref:hypothetical protein n=1 Tax=Kribbella sp. NPDC006257 TaxID=3156738 RepID=UPI0033AB112E
MIEPSTNTQPPSKAARSPVSAPSTSTTGARSARSSSTTAPLSAALTISRLLGESAIGRHRDPDEFYRPSEQSYEDLLAYADKQGDS